MRAPHRWWLDRTAGDRRRSLLASAVRVSHAPLCLGRETAGARSRPAALGPEFSALTRAFERPSVARILWYRETLVSRRALVGPSANDRRGLDGSDDRQQTRSMNRSTSFNQEIPIDSWAAVT
jgi:hypothetical protein